MGEGGCCGWWEGDLERSQGSIEFADLVGDGDVILCRRT